MVSLGGLRWGQESHDGLLLSLERTPIFAGAKASAKPLVVLSYFRNGKMLGAKNRTGVLAG